MSQQSSSRSRQQQQEPSNFIQKTLLNIWDNLDFLGRALMGDLWRTIYLSIQDAIALGVLLTLPSLVGRVIIGKDFSGFNSFANLRGADLRGADLEGANSTSADLKGANLSNFNLNRVNLNGANLNEADLSNTNLKNAFLIGSYLNGAKLNRANLNEADLSGADLSFADLTDAIVEKTRFINSLGISESLKQNLYARGAKFEDSPGDHSEVFT
jgi:uncharacterized protein YjbI with pentapeptide repeats